jgi:hypothetical protein
MRPADHRRRGQESASAAGEIRGECTTVAAMFPSAIALRVDEIQNGLELTQTWRARMPFCKRLDISHFEPGRPGQGVETCDCRIYFSAPADVEDCACRSGLGKVHPGCAFHRRAARRGGSSHPVADGDSRTPIRLARPRRSTWLRVERPQPGRRRSPGDVTIAMPHGCDRVATAAHASPGRRQGRSPGIECAADGGSAHRRLALRFR